MFWVRGRHLKALLRQLSPAKPKLKFAKELCEELRVKAQSEDKYLIATNTGGNWPILSVDILLGIGLRLRQKSVAFVLCDGALGACQQCEIQTLDPTEILEGKLKTFSVNHALA